MSLAYEPFDATVREDPYPLFAELRARAPLHWSERMQAWCVTRYADAHAVLRSAEDFSSDAMRTMLTGGQPGVDPAQDPAALQRMLAFAQALPFSPQELLTARNLIAEDPPRHGHLAFGFGNHFCLGASLARLEARVVLEALLAALLDELPALRRGEPRGEYVDSFMVRGPRRLPLRKAAWA